METKSLYFTSQLQGRNVVKDAIYNFFFLFCSFPRMLLEVFIRKNFGVRYFSFTTAMFIAFILAIMPPFIYAYALILPGIIMSQNFYTVHFLSWYEPGIFFVPGLILAILGQFIGWLLMIAAVFYSMGYRAAYHRGAEMVFEQGDSIILNRQMERAFVDDLMPSETGGLQIRSPRPKSRDVRKQIVDGILDEDEELEVK